MDVRNYVMCGECNALRQPSAHMFYLRNNLAFPARCECNYDLWVQCGSRNIKESVRRYRLLMFFG